MGETFPSLSGTVCVFLVRVEGASDRWHSQKPFLALRFRILASPSKHFRFPDTSILQNAHSGKLNWFLRDFGYDTELFSRAQIDEKALLNLRGVVRTIFTNLNGRSYQNLDSFAPAAEWDTLSCTSMSRVFRSVSTMTFSYTQRANYLRFPRSYRYRYLDGRREKETRAALALADASKKRSRPIFAGRTAAQRYSRSGARFVMPRLPTKRARPGIA